MKSRSFLYSHYRSCDQQQEVTTGGKDKEEENRKWQEEDGAYRVNELIHGILAEFLIYWKQKLLNCFSNISGR